MKLYEGSNLTEIQKIRNVGAIISLYSYFQYSVRDLIKKNLHLINLKNDKKRVSSLIRINFIEALEDGKRILDVNEIEKLLDGLMNGCDFNIQKNGKYEKFVKKHTSTIQKLNDFLSVIFDFKIENVIFSKEKNPFGNKVNKIDYSLILKLESIRNKVAHEIFHQFKSFNNGEYAICNKSFKKIIKNLEEHIKKRKYTS